MKLMKLVRDRVEEFLGDSTVQYLPLSKSEHKVELRKKLIEESIEYLSEPSLEELADVYEVVCALAQVDLDLNISEVMYEAREKREERGGFDFGIGMFCDNSNKPS